MMSQDEHLEWAKRRALEYLDAGDTKNAFTSMMSDLSEHPDLKNHPGIRIGVGLMLLPGWIHNVPELRRWIVGFR